MTNRTETRQQPNNSQTEFGWITHAMLAAIGVVERWKLFANPRIRQLLTTDEITHRHTSPFQLHDLAAERLNRMPLPESEQSRMTGNELVIKTLQLIFNRHQATKIMRYIEKMNYDFADLEFEVLADEQASIDGFKLCKQDELFIRGIIWNALEGYLSPSLINHKSNNFLLAINLHASEPALKLDLLHRQAMLKMKVEKATQFPIQLSMVKTFIREFFDSVNDAVKLDRRLQHDLESNIDLGGEARTTFWAVVKEAKHEGKLVHIESLALENHQGFINSLLQRGAFVDLGNYLCSLRMRSEMVIELLSEFWQQFSQGFLLAPKEILIVTSQLRFEHETAKKIETYLEAHPEIVESIDNEQTQAQVVAAFLQQVLNTEYKKNPEKLEREIAFFIRDFQRNLKNDHVLALLALEKRRQFTKQEAFGRSHVKLLKLMLSTLDLVDIEWKSNIALDGGVAVGSSSVIKILKNEVGLSDISIGYEMRAVTMFALQRGLSPQDLFALGMHIDTKLDQQKEQHCTVKIESSAHYLTDVLPQDELDLLITVLSSTTQLSRTELADALQAADQLVGKKMAEKIYKWYEIYQSVLSWLMRHSHPSDVMKPPNKLEPILQDRKCYLAISSEQKQTQMLINIPCLDLDTNYDIARLKDIASYDYVNANVSQFSGFKEIERAVVESIERLAEVTKGLVFNGRNTEVIFRQLRDIAIYLYITCEETWNRSQARAESGKTQPLTEQQLYTTARVDVLRTLRDINNGILAHPLAVIMAGDGGSIHDGEPQYDIAIDTTHTSPQLVTSMLLAEIIAIAFGRIKYDGTTESLLKKYLAVCANLTLHLVDKRRRVISGQGPHVHGGTTVAQGMERSFEFNAVSSLPPTPKSDTTFSFARWLICNNLTDNNVNN